MISFVVGRSESDAIISVGPNYNNVSRRHLEVSLLDENRCRVVDLGSANGTEVLNDGKWERVQKVVVGLDHKLRLGREYETTVRQLLAKSGQPPPPVNGTRVLVDKSPDRQARPDAMPLPVPASAKLERGFSGRAGPVRGVCHTCGQSVYGEFCNGCGARLVANAQGMLGVVAQDMFKFGENEALLPRLLALVYAPVRATLALAHDPYFKLHPAMFVLATVIYLGWSNLLEHLTYRQLGLAQLLKTLPVSVGYAFLGPILFFTFFIFAFIIGYYVFCDYSKSPRPPRDYLKLCCISFLVSVMAFVILTFPVFLQLIHVIPRGFGSWLLAVVGLSYLVFQLRYNVLITTQFWGISTVSAFRGLLVAYMLAMVALALIVVMLALVYRILAVPLGL
jgi:FHA domain